MSNKREKLQTLIRKYLFMSIDAFGEFITLKFNLWIFYTNKYYNNYFHHTFPKIIINNIINYNY